MTEEEQRQLAIMEKIADDFCGSPESSGVCEKSTCAECTVYALLRAGYRQEKDINREVEERRTKEISDWLRYKAEQEDDPYVARKIEELANTLHKDFAEE